VPQRIDLLIDANLSLELLKTHLGWILSGGGQQGPKHSSFIETHRLSEERGGISLDELVARFWEIEHVTEPIALK